MAAHCLLSTVQVIARVQSVNNNETTDHTPHLNSGGRDCSRHHDVVHSCWAVKCCAGRGPVFRRPLSAVQDSP